MHVKNCIFPPDSCSEKFILEIAENQPTGPMEKKSSLPAGSSANDSGGFPAERKMEILEQDEPRAILEEEEHRAKEMEPRMEGAIDQAPRGNQDLEICSETSGNAIREVSRGEGTPSADRQSSLDIFTEVAEKVPRQEDRKFFAGPENKVSPNSVVDGEAPLPLKLQLG